MSNIVKESFIKKHLYNLKLFLANQEFDPDL